MKTTNVTERRGEPRAPRRGAEGDEARARGERREGAFGVFKYFEFEINTMDFQWSTKAIWKLKD